MDEINLTRIVRDLLIASGCSDSIETHEDNPEIVHNELLVGGTFRIVVEPVAHDTAQGTVTQPTNQIGGVETPGPVIFKPRDPDQPTLEISRLHLSVPKRASSLRGHNQKTVTVTMHHGSTVDEQLVGVAVFDEDTFIDGVMMLFPGGELVPRGSVGDGPWPFRQVAWETSDGQTWPDPAQAMRRQSELDRDVTKGNEGQINLWYFIVAPEDHVIVGKARTQDDFDCIRRGIEVATGYKFYGGFASPEDLQVLRDKLGV